MPDATTADIDKAVAAARTAFDEGPWPRMTPVERAAILTKVSEALKAEMEPMAELITTEMGSPGGLGDHGPGLRPHHDLRLLRRAGLDVRSSTRSARASWARCSWPRSRWAWWVPSAPGTSRCSSPPPSSVPSLVAGCTVVFKPAPETPLDALRLAEMFEEAGLPDGRARASSPPAARWASTW